MTDLPRVSHQGTIRIDDLAFECVVLDDPENTRAYIQRQLTQAIGFARDRRGAASSSFLQIFAPNHLSELEKTDVQHTVKMPHGGHAKIFKAGILTEIASNVIDAAVNGSLKHHYRHLVPSCMAILRALAKTGEVALIDEATGYQYHRAPDALQDLFGMLIRETCSDWDRRFNPDYYRAIFRLFGWEYTGQSLKPSVVGQITERLVYGAVFPTDVMEEIRERRGGRCEKLHQWLKDGGIKLLEHQIKAITMMANSSTDYADFNNRCTVAFPVPGQLGFVFPSPRAGGAA